MAKDQLVIEGKIKKSELKNRGSSPTTGTAKPSDILLIESLQKNKQLQKKKDRDNIYELSVDKGGWFK
ncbi:hypothetical protein HY448_01010 [Candidatus Pacearchaeota archaeon]|nr:hypothetical protein [Candidatus Pacearchaeota archaeon]